MQERAIEKAATLPNLLLLAPTGSGKTLAFLIPLLDRLKPDGNGVQALIVAPSRELSLQIEQVFKAMKTSYKVSCCYGGHPFLVEQNSLRDTPVVVIGTPGRLADHLTRKSFRASSVRMLVLDEFDKTLQMGFHEPLSVIFDALSGKEQRILTSATRLDVWPKFLPFQKPETLNFLGEEVPSKLKLFAIKTTSDEKVETLARLVAGFDSGATLVFCNHREAVERISELLTKRKIEHGVLHGALEQIDREKNLIKFRGKAHHILVATDLASRGLDIPEIKHVVHYQLPVQQEAFVHRNGRTARMHADGQAYFILANDETLPGYIEKDVEEYPVSKKMPALKLPEFVCLYVSAGKKDKIDRKSVV